MAYIVYETATNRIVGVHVTQAAANAAAAPAELTAHTGAVTGANFPDDTDVGWFFVSNACQKAAPAATEAQKQGAWRGRLHIAWRGYLDAVRQDWWSWAIAKDSNDAAKQDRPLRATDIWAYQQIALGDVLVGVTTLTDAVREAAVAQIEKWVGRDAEVWYKVMRDNSVGTTANNSSSGRANSWASAGIADGTALYSDILTGAGVLVSPDGSFTLVSPTRVIRAGFNPDHADLSDS